MSKTPIESLIKHYEKNEHVNFSTPEVIRMAREQINMMPDQLTRCLLHVLIERLVEAATEVPGIKMVPVSVSKPNDECKLKGPLLLKMKSGKHVLGSYADNYDLFASPEHGVIHPHSVESWLELDEGWQDEKAKAKTR